MRMNSYLFRLMLYATTCAVVSAILAAGAGLLLTALWFALRASMSPALAAVSTGLAALVGGALIVAVGRAVGGRRSRGGPLASLIEGASSRHEHEFAAELGALVGREAASLIEAHAGRAAVAAAAVGFVIGASPRLRGVLRELLK